MTDEDYSEDIMASFAKRSLVGKLFIGVHYGCMRSGLVEAAIGGHHFLVRFDDFIGFTDGQKWPEALAVVSIADMVGGADIDHDEEPPPWLFFDNEEQRATYEAWLDQPPSDRTPRVVPLRSPPAKQ